MRFVVVAALLVVGRDLAAAAPTCDPAEAASLRAHLESQQHKADNWNVAWRITFSAAAVGTAAVGYWNPYPSLQAGLYGSAGKATVGALARWILPLRVHPPPQTADTCADVAALRAEVARVGRKERSLFWMGHIGGILVNAGGVAYVWSVDGAGKALLSFAIGYPVGVLSTYTMPRGAWHTWRDATWTAVVLPTEHGWQLALAGTF